MSVGDGCPPKESTNTASGDKPSELGWSWNVVKNQQEMSNTSF